MVSEPINQKTIDVQCFETLQPFYFVCNGSPLDLPNMLEHKNTVERSFENFPRLNGDNDGRGDTLGRIDNEITVRSTVTATAAHVRR